MCAATRMILILALMLALTGGLAAQETTDTTATTTTAATATTTAETAAEAESTGDTAGTAAGRPSSEETRNQLIQLFQRQPNDLPTVLVLEPTLLSNETFLKGYPELAEFIATHPEVARNPSFYLANYTWRRERRSALEEIVETMSIFGIFVFIALALAWFVRTVIEQKRWSRLSKTQSEVHNKILDRFGTTAELMEYIKTPAGTKFLESAPIPLHTERRPPSTPMPRVMWSIQIGVVIAAAALGMLLVSGRFDRETSQDLFALGTIGFAVGAGFIASAAVSIFLSRRLGVWQTPPDDSGTMQ